MASFNAFRTFYGIQNNVLSKVLFVIVFRSNCRSLKNMSSKANLNQSLPFDVQDSDNSILDTFTMKLMEEKLIKWNSLKKYKDNISSAIKEDMCEEQLSNIDNVYRDRIVQLNQTFANAMKDVDGKSRTYIKDKLHDCVEHKICPSREILLTLASSFARLGDKDIIKTIQKLCIQEDKNEYTTQAGYKHFLAEATWVHGNTEESLQLFYNVYSNYTFLRRKVRHMVKFLIADAFSKKGEAALILAINFAKKLACQHKDFYVLAHVWEFCFLSEWYTDNIIAHELLKQHPQLRDVVRKRIPSVAISALREHKVEVVHRLLELLLRYQMKQQYEHVLRSMFDYKCLEGDIRSCSAIIQSSLDLDVSLTPEQHQRFLNLLFNHKTKWIVGQTKQPPQPKQTLSITHFQMKF